MLIFSSSLILTINYSRSKHFFYAIFSKYKQSKNLQILIQCQTITILRPNEYFLKAQLNLFPILTIFKIIFELNKPTFRIQYFKVQTQYHNSKVKDNFLSY